MNCIGAESLILQVAECGMVSNHSRHVFLKVFCRSMESLFRIELRGHSTRSDPEKGPERDPGKDPGKDPENADYLGG